MADIKIAPSILSSNFGKLNAEIAEVEAHSDMLHVDVMDGHFVPNLSFGAPVVRCIETKLPLNCHLMVENPENYIDAFTEAGAHTITFHIETVEDAKATVEKIHAAGVKAGISLNPATDVSEIDAVLDSVDSVLVMSVVPGFGGQTFMEDTLSKVRSIRERYPDLDIEIDGGINAETAKLAVEAGANILVAGSYIFKSEDRIAAIESLRAA